VLRVKDLAAILGDAVRPQADMDTGVSCCPLARSLMRTGFGFIGVLLRASGYPETVWPLGLQGRTGVDGRGP
jgi:hypothetical protein